jgi:O-antigen ligase
MKNFRIACDDPVIGLPEKLPMRCATHPHNRYLEFLTESGVPGFVGFVALVAAWGRRLWQGWHMQPRNVWLMGPMTAIVMVFLWPFGPTSSFFSNWFGVMFWVSLGWALAAVRLRESPLQSP